jgi:hypothetical protein
MNNLNYIIDVLITSEETSHLSYSDFMFDSSFIIFYWDYDNVKFSVKIFLQKTSEHYGYYLWSLTNYEEKTGGYGNCPDTLRELLDVNFPKVL